jgi:hypothetical protein
MKAHAICLVTVLSTGACTVEPGGEPEISGRRELVSVPGPDPIVDTITISDEASLMLVTNQWTAKIGDPLNEGVSRVFLAEANPPPPAAGVTCSLVTFTVGIPAIASQCTLFGGSPDEFGFDLCPFLAGLTSVVVQRTVCVREPVAGTPSMPDLGPVPAPGDPRIRTDLSILPTVLASGDFDIVSLGPARPGIDGAARGLKKGGKYALPADFGGRCPFAFARVSSPRLASLGGPELCVDSGPIDGIQNPTFFLDSLIATAADLELNPSRTDVYDRIIQILRDVLGPFIVTTFCSYKSDSLRAETPDDFAGCFKSTGDAVSAGFKKLLALGICPVVPDFTYMEQCVGRGEQSDIGCFAISCIKELNELPLAACATAVASRLAALVPLPFSPIVSPVAGLAACKEIEARNHFYTAPKNGVPTEICDSRTNSLCDYNLFVRGIFFSDARNEAPGILQGPPINGKPQRQTTTPIPIVSGNTYYLDPSIDLKLFSTPTGLTSNPIQIFVEPGRPIFIAGQLRNCLQVTRNVAKIDHLLEGEVAICLFQEGTKLKAIAEGRGTRTRLALLNEQVGPIVIEDAINFLKKTLGDRLGPPPIDRR